MSLDADDEILQDFLVEAGEILELLSEQLVDLENSPEDYDLLNAVFRGFHTIKGGAGFLNITALVEVCHTAEDVFNVLRQGQRSVDADLMDIVLQVVDVVNEMFDDVRSAVQPDSADANLLKQLERYSIPEGEAPSEADETAEPVVSSSPPVEEKQPVTQASTTTTNALDDLINEVVEPESATSASDDISEEEFENLLDELHGKGKHGGVTKVAEASSEGSSDDDITEEEFENLLDEIHGVGKHGGAPSVTSNNDEESNSNDDITEEEFENLLDDIHGKGKHTAIATPKTEVVTEKPIAAPVNETAPAAPEPVTKSVAKKPKTPPAPAKAKPTAEASVRVDTKRLDDIMNMVGELVLVRNRFSTLRNSLNDEKVINAIGNLDVVTSDLQLSVMKTRMQPIKKVFGRFPRVIRDLARSLDKEIELEMVGEDTDLDKNLVESLADPLIHLVRNAVDHGVESPDEREAVGKPRTGHVQLAARQEGDHIMLIINDDGKGMDPDVLRGLAVERGMMDEEAASRLDDKECYNLIFQPGFSTKTEISDVSGRGVGMDVVKTRIAQMNGTVEIDSEKGKGSQITIKLPLTLAILPTLMVVLGDQPFALPLANVVEIFNLDKTKTNVVDGQLTIRVRDRALPLFYLSQWLVKGYVQDDNREGHVVVVSMNNMQIGLVVDTLLGQEEVVIKPLGAMLHGVQGMAGATITGDGNIALILDVPGLMRQYAARY